MAADVTYFGSYSGIVNNITLSPTSVEGIAIALPTTPARYYTQLKGVSANTSLGGSIVVTSVSPTTISFANSGAQTISGVCFIEIATTIDA